MESELDPISLQYKVSGTVGKNSADNDNNCHPLVSHATAYLGRQLFEDSWLLDKSLPNRWRMAISAFSKMCKICSSRVSTWPLLLVVILGFPLTPHSAEVLDSTIIREHGRYMMHTETVVQAPVSKVRALLMDYQNFPRLNPDIKRVESLERLDNRGIRMGVSSEFCILAICLHYDWVQDVRHLPDGDIVMIIVPNQGDFQQGIGRWRLLPNAGGGTLLIFDIDLTPKYWLPPVFGSWLMKQKLSEKAFEFAEGLEKMAALNCC